MEQLENCYMVCKMRNGEFNGNDCIFQLWLKEFFGNGPRTWRYTYCFIGCVCC